MLCKCLFLIMKQKNEIFLMKIVRYVLTLDIV